MPDLSHFEAVVRQWGMNTRARIHVIGGGLAGLTAAAFVARAGIDVVLHESNGHAGGRARTDQRDGYRFDRGPHALYAGGAGSAVLSELGIRPRGARPAVKGVMVDGDRLFPAPSAPGSLLRTGLFTVREKTAFGRVMARIQSLDPTRFAHRSAADWVDEAMPTDRSRAVLHSFVRLSTYVNAPELLSAAVAIEQLQLGTKPGVLYLDGGWQQLVDALVVGADESTRAAVTFSLGERIDELPDGDAVIVAAGGSDVAARLTGADFGTWTPADVSCLDLGLTGPPPHRFALGVDQPVYASDHGIAQRRAPGDGSAFLLAEYLSPGAEPTPGLLDELARTLGIPDDVVATRRTLHRMTATTAIPTAAGGGQAGRPGVAVTGRPGVFVAGDWVGPTGHLADAALASGREAALAAVRHVSALPVPG